MEESLIKENVSTMKNSIIYGFMASVFQLAYASMILMTTMEVLDEVKQHIPDYSRQLTEIKDTIAVTEAKATQVINCLLKVSNLPTYTLACLASPVGRL